MKSGGTVFKYFSDLTELDLSVNNIKKLPESIFAHLDKLEILNLSRNSLLFIEFQLSHMKHLQVLDLSENLISQFDTNLKENVDLIKSRSPNFTMALLDNPFQCSCETRSSLFWMHQRQSIFCSI